MHIRGLSEIGIEWLESRRIHVETATRFDLYTASVIGSGDDKELVPDMRNGRILVTPYYHHSIDVTEKYRALPKQAFWQKEGGLKTFFNADILDRDEVRQGAPVLITEGEVDALSAIQCGKDLTMSVPDGAPPVPKDLEARAADMTDAEWQQIVNEGKVESDEGGKFEYLWNNRHRIQNVRRFVIGTDCDPPGRRLAAELVRRLGAARCSFIEYPPGCKDLNDVLMKLGGARVVEVIEHAKPYPVRGLYQLSQYPEQDVETFSSGWETLDQHFRILPGEFIVVTGIPGHGKTIWTLNLLAHLAEQHAWCSAIFSPEMRVMPYMRNRLRMIKRGSDEAHPETDAWIEENFVFVDSDPTGVGPADEDYDLQWLIERFQDAVLRFGIRVAVIDPWNEIEHAKRKDEQMVDYISRAIRALKRFGRLYGVTVIVIAHPTKDVMAGGKYRTPSLYDIDGAAHWFNKADHGIVIERPPDTPIGRAKIHIMKSKMEEMGFRGVVMMQFETRTCRYRKLEESDHAPSYATATGASASRPPARAEPDIPF